MAIFRDLILPWKGRDYIIPGDRITAAIAAMERVLTLSELWQYQERRTPPMATFAQAYAVLLQIGGAKVDENEVFARLLSENDAQQNAADIVKYLFTRLMADAAAVVRPASGNAPGPAPKRPGRSSRTSTKRSSELDS